MKQDEYLKVLKQCHLLRLMAHEVSGLDEAILSAGKAETLGPLVDPTAYREKGDALLEDIQVLKAVQRLVSDTPVPEREREIG